MSSPSNRKNYKGGKAMKKSLSLMALIPIFLTCMACSETAEEWNKKARNAYSAKNSDEAIECYKRAIAIDPNNVKAHYFLGWVYESRGMLDEAIFEYKKGIVIKPNGKVLHNSLGGIYLGKGMIDEAISEFKKTIAINSDFAVAHYNLGIAYRKKGQHTLADEHLYQAGFLAFVQGNRKVALKVYRGLEEIKSEELTQDLNKLLSPLIESESGEK